MIDPDNYIFELILRQKDNMWLNLGMLGIGIFLLRLLARHESRIFLPFATGSLLVAVFVADALWLMQAQALAMPIGKIKRIKRLPPA